MKRKQLRAILVDCNRQEHHIVITLLKGETQENAIKRLAYTVAAVRDRIRVNSGFQKEKDNETK